MARLIPNRIDPKEKGNNRLAIVYENLKNRDLSDESICR